MLLPYSQESIDRQKKIQDLKNAGVIVYANNFRGKQDIRDIKLKSWKFVLENGQLKELSSDIVWNNHLKSSIKDAKQLMEEGALGEFKTAGRLMLSRSMWKLIFMNIQDNTEKIQLCFMKGKAKFNTWKKIVDSLFIDWEEKSSHKIAEKYLQVWDYIGVIWDLFVTKHWELTLFVKEFQILAKAVRPLPEKFHGIQDQERIYRQRYLDLIMNEDSYKRFLFRSEFISTLREFYYKNGFIELDTPILWNAASGAAAKPFITHHNDFDIDVYLRIAPETSLKKATVGRFEKVFEIGRNFRNEGSDPSHMQEFTAVEHYVAWWNFEDNMVFTEKMFDYLFERLNLPKKIKIKDRDWNEREINWATPWERIDYVEWIKKVTGLDISKYSMDDDE